VWELNPEFFRLVWVGETELELETAELEIISPGTIGVGTGKESSYGQ